MTTMMSESIEKPPSSCMNEGIFSGVSLLRFGRSIPIVELFEVFLITGFILIAVSTGIYFTFHNVSEILKSSGGSPASVNVANAAANAQPVWIGIGVLIFVLGIVFYYLHRRVQRTAL